MVSSLFLELSYLKKRRILRDQMFDLFPSDYLTIIHLLFSSFPFTSRDSSAINTCDRVNLAKRGWQWNPRLWCSTSTQTRQSAEGRKKENKKKAAWRARLHHVSQLFSVLFNPTPPTQPVCLPVSQSPWGVFCLFPRCLSPCPFL